MLSLHLVFLTFSIIMIKHGLFLNINIKTHSPTFSFIWPNVVFFFPPPNFSSFTCYFNLFSFYSTSISSFFLIVFPYFSLFLSRYALFLFSLFLFLPIRQLIEEKESLYVLFSMENYYYTLNEYFFLFDGLYFFFC